MAVNWDARRARWAAHKAIKAGRPIKDSDLPGDTCAVRRDIENANVIRDAYREHVEDRGRDFVEDTKHSHD